MNRGGSHFVTLGEQDVLAEAGSVVLAGVPGTLRLVCRGGQIDWNKRVRQATAG